MSLASGRRPTVTRSPDSATVAHVAPSGAETTTSAARPRSPGDERNSIDHLSHVHGLAPCSGPDSMRARLHTQEENMKKALALAGLVSLITGIGTASLSAAPQARKFSPHQEPRGIGNLVARGDRVLLVYDAGVKSATGAVDVRNDLQRRFVRGPLRPLDLAPRQPERPHARLEPGRARHDRALGPAAGPHRGQRRRARPGRFDLRDERRRTRPRLPHGSLAPRLDGPADLDEQA